VEIRKEDLKYVEWDKTLGFIRAVKESKKKVLPRINVFAFTTSFQKRLVIQESSVPFFTYYGLAEFYALATIVLGYRWTKDVWSWESSLLPYLLVGMAAIFGSFVLARITFVSCSILKKIFFRKNKKTEYRRNFYNSRQNYELQNSILKINHPEKTKFPENLNKLYKSR